MLASISSFQQLRAIKSKKAILVANVIDEIIGIFGPLEIIQSDNGKEFIAEVIQLLAERWKIRLINGRPRRPQTQGLVEQANSTVQARLSKWKREHGSGKWTAALPQIAYSINNTIHEAIRQCPFEIMFAKRNEFRERGQALVLKELKDGSFIPLKGLRMDSDLSSDNELESSDSEGGDSDSEALDLQTQLQLRAQLTVK
jgi:hypothetical protein